MALLYETLVRSATAEGSEVHEQMRFITDPQVTKGLGDVRLDLLSGRWPSKEFQERTASFSIEIGFRRRRWFGLLPSRGYHLVMVENARIGKRDVGVIEEATHTAVGTIATAGDKIDPGMLSGSVWSALDSSVIILLVDASKALAMGGDAPSIERVDVFHATLLRVILNHKPKLHGRNKDGPLPVLFLTKCDVLSATSGGAGGTRSSAMEILRKHFPLTAKVLEEGGAEGMRAPKVKVFISGMRTEKDEGGRTVPSPVTDHGQVRLEYEQDQYASLIQFLGTVAREHPPVGKGQK